MRQFETGAIRDTAEGKVSYKGLLSPQVIRRFGQYMQLHCTQADGQRRSFDNWKKGIPRDAYLDSLWRHFLDLWEAHEGAYGTPEEQQLVLEDAACAMLFNLQGYLHELIRERTTEA